MSDLKKKFLSELADSVVNMDEAMTADLAQRYIENHFNPLEGINQGLAQGMDRAGVLYEEEEYFIPELLMCSDAMYAGLDVLRPHLQKREGDITRKAVIGVVQGDTHDIGKNLVKIMLETVGFEVADLGRDVPPIDFIVKAKEIQADIIALSTLMTTTMEGMQEVMQLLEKEKLQEKIKVMVGGGPISKGFADRIGAYYADDASKAANLALNLVKEG
ncbi:putative cobalamin binding protein [Desulfosporosinus orientis DSM 765]|uniref:Putative cobalamin binding protein n=1 Tax=Desulfosporosinus orientis (strain ATCC 19365 / DSM 765 / NCIMB 8382 / VKM B-1628 / Singapore I) TaxID=768706 RepID=G7WFF1_DESOD|nr:corrinoid protein [Desulfosporosinus orientis]AET68394.1 putative cobalamin binding protein [Desulfosporosinus orientis DSM 765]